MSTGRWVQPSFVGCVAMAGKVDLKVVLLGKEYGGKTSLVERYIHGKFNSNAPYQSVSAVPVRPCVGVGNAVSCWVGSSCLLR